MRWKIASPDSLPLVCPAEPLDQLQASPSLLDFAAVIRHSIYIDTSNEVTSIFSDFHN